MRILPFFTLAMLATCPYALGQGSAAAGSRVLATLDWEAGTFGSSPSWTVALGKTAPAGVQLPAGMSRPLFGRLTIADGELAVALDANPGNPRLWVDRDFDRDLAEERTTRLTRKGRSFSRSQVVLAPYDGESQPSPLELQWTCDVAGQPRLTARLMMHRRGTVVLGGRLRLVALTDGNRDGRFDDVEQDRLYVDTNGDGELSYRGNDERVAIGQPFRVGEEGWIPRVVSSSGRAVEFERAATVPPATPRKWSQPYGRPTAGVERKPPAESLATLLQRVDDERSRPGARRLATINLIGNVGTAAAFDALTELAAAEEEAMVRGAALRALGNPAFLAARGDRLADLAEAADRTTAASIYQALYMAGHPKRDAIYADVIAGDEQTLVSAAARWLAYADTEEARDVITKAVERGDTPAARYGAYVSGARNLPGGPPVETALQAAADDYAALRAAAIQDLGVLGHPEAVPLALAAAELRPIDVATGKAVCQVLGAAGTPDAVTAMLGLLEDDRLHASVKKEVVDQLRLVRAEQSLEVLVNALRSKRPAVRAVAAEILAVVPQRRVTEALVKQAKREREAEVLALLLEALGDHGDALALSTLQRRTRSRDPVVRLAAVRGLARLGFHHDKVRAFFLSMLESREWVDRVLALDAAKAAGQVGLLPKVTRSLDHRRWQVRLAAVETLAALRAREAVLPLIERLEEEEERRVRDAIARGLFTLTGVNAYDNVKTWRLWWSENGKTFVVPEEVPVLPERTADGTVAGFYGIPVDSERVVFLIDQSGSMNAMGQAKEHYDEKELNRLDVAVRETLGALGKLDDRARVNVIMFHSRFHPWEDELQRLGPNRKKLERMLESQKPQGGTNIYDGLEFALRMEDVDTIFLLSDGSPGQGKFVATEDILRGVRRENQTRRIVIHCVAIGMDSKLLRELARENGGRYARR